LSSEEQNKEQQQEKPQQSQQQDNYYQRKKNWVGGIDNDNLLGLGLLLVGGIAAVAAYPAARDFWNNFMSRYNGQQYNPPPVNGNGYPTNGEAYIPPTEALPQQQQQPLPIIQEQQREQANPQKLTVEEQQQAEETTDVDGRFYEDEMRKKAKMMGKRDRVKYESPFGKDIGGLG
jgi:hypothetical protein